MSTLPGVGNDIVDLKEPENLGKSGDDRFLGRVFTVEERGLIARAAAPDTLLWALWAAKEAAFKAVSGGDPGDNRLLVCSIPRRYPVRLETLAQLGNQIPEAKRSHVDGEAEAEAGSLLAGRVITPCGAVALRITVTDEYVHAVAAKQDADIAGIIQRVDQMDDGGNPGDPSAFVRRRLIAEISRRLDRPVDDFTVRGDPAGSGAPRVFLQDRPLAAEISLSHDGRFTAFAIAFC
jgi:phosphopantetheinyl transferase (holo-ACP synthase)